MNGDRHSRLIRSNDGYGSLYPVQALTVRRPLSDLKPDLLATGAGLPEWAALALRGSQETQDPRMHRRYLVLAAASIIRRLDIIDAVTEDMESNGDDEPDVDGVHMR